jgi:hypothetical protein
MMKKQFFPFVRLSPPLRRRSRTIRKSAIAAACALFGFAASASAQFTISTSSGLFTPSFRDLTNNDLANTTFFGWGPSTGWGVSGNFAFDGLTDNELIDNPPALQGIGGLTGTLNQIGTNDVLSSSNNIYTSTFTDQYLRLEIPVQGVAGTGFTTIIVQGRTVFGGYPSNSAADFEFPTLGGAPAQVVVGPNAAGRGQFWVKYEIAGQAAQYTLDFGLRPGFVSVAELQVDTQWSESGFAPDTAQAVPEPSAFAALLGGATLLGLGRRRKVPCAPIA